MVFTDGDGVTEVETWEDGIKKKKGPLTGPGNSGCVPQPLQEGIRRHREGDRMTPADTRTDCFS